MFSKLISLTVITVLALAACSLQAANQPALLPTDSISGQESGSPQTGEGQDQSEAYPGPAAGEAQPEEPLPYPGVEQPSSQGPTYVAPAPSDYAPQPGDDQLTRGEVFLQVVDSQLQVMESYPVQVVVVLRGELPDACHKLRLVVTPPNSQNMIQIEAYTVIETDQLCAAVLVPFEVPISLGSFAGGSFSVVINGEVLGKFE